MSQHVVVVGAGAVGLITAYHLRRGGADVTLVDARETGRGAAEVNAGWIVPAEPMTIRALPGDSPSAHDAVTTESGRFELTDLPVGLLRLRLEPHDTSRPAFATPTFEI